MWDKARLHESQNCYLITHEDYPLLRIKHSGLMLCALELHEALRNSDEQGELFTSYCPISVFLSILGFDLYIHDRHSHASPEESVLQG